MTYLRNVIMAILAVFSDPEKTESPEKAETSENWLEELEKCIIHSAFCDSAQ